MQTKNTDVLHVNSTCNNETKMSAFRSFYSNHRPQVHGSLNTLQCFDATSRLSAVLQLN